MNGETNIQTLLETMAPEMSDEFFVFLSMDPFQVPKDLKPEGIFREKEGTTIICDESEAQKYSLAYNGRYRRITLNVHSSLEAVGFLSAIAAELTRGNISCNVVSAFYHDHLFVLESDAARALAILESMTKRN